MATKKAGKAVRHQRRSQQARPGGWKRPFIWMASVASALVIAAAVAFGTGVGQHLYRSAFGNPVSPANPVQIDSAAYVRTDDATFAFRNPLTSTQVRALTHNPYFSRGGVPLAWPQYITLVQKYGGASEDAMIQIVLQSHATQTVTITNIEEVKRCGPPLTGTLLYSPGAGAPPDIKLIYDLDPPFPAAQYQDSRGGLRNFFTEKTIQLRPKEVNTLIIQSITYHAYCQFTFKMMVDDGTSHATESISDNGKPFVVTAFSDPSPTWSGIEYPIMKFSDFKEIYAGGVVSPHLNDTYVRVNPKTYKGGE